MNGLKLYWLEYWAFFESASQRGCDVFGFGLESAAVS